jgi:hypothetical protein
MNSDNVKNALQIVLNVMLVEHAKNVTVVAHGIRWLLVTVQAVAMVLVHKEKHVMVGTDVLHAKTKKNAPNVKMKVII